MKEDPEKYIACVPKGKIYEASGLIDAGNLLWVMRKMAGYAFIDNEILEFGCGNGRMSQFLEPFFGTYFLADISKEALKLAKKKLGEENKIYCQMKENKIPIKADVFFYVFSFTVLMHNKKSDVKEIFKEFARVMKRGGLLFFQLPSYFNSKEIVQFNDVALWTADEIVRLAGDDFEIIRIESAMKALGSEISEEHFKYHIFRKK